VGLLLKSKPKIQIMYFFFTFSFGVQTPVAIKIINKIALQDH